MELNGRGRLGLSTVLNRVNTDPILYGQVSFRRGVMSLTGLTVVHAAADFDGTIIHGFDGGELVLTLVTTTALNDHFGWPWSLPDQKLPALGEYHLVVDRNLAALEPIIQDKYRRADYRILHRFGSSLKFIEITYADIPRGRLDLTDNVIQVARAARFAQA